ncbi:hypothetical protein CH373_15185 [Leptospira perolatii]|uniref:Alginate export domain-containing protein n=1 Tax=Leptospira perolatii TaxID=2023191 RepID=A0A2M9ZJN7_9LEPT|nr:hypothetical protein [Leptospira perolatii]PJZ69441.1 hypothetical protein CH360_10525 [Leptospira perolatii]PJZ72266.1 hypothetical protein CH373_15185 [Leptospira perolatii]
MRTLGLFLGWSLYLFCNLEIFAETKKEEKTLYKMQLGFMGFRAHSVYKENGLFGETLEQQKAGVALPIFLEGFLQSTEREYQVELSLSLLGDPDGSVRIFPGKNSYISLLTKDVSLGIGRKSDPEAFPSFKSWSDGVEGLFIESRNFAGVKLRLDLLDLYRGFPLRETKWLQSAASFLPDAARTKLSFPDFETGENNLRTVERDLSFRYRAGFHLEGRNVLNSIGSLYYLFQVRYISLGNWGRFSRDTLEARGGEKSGDNDYLTHWQFGSGWTGRIVFFGLDTMFSRGLDKTAAHPQRSEKSLAISGEAVRISAGTYGDWGSFRIHGFLSDPDKRASNGEILELGFVGMGNRPFSNPLLQQIWRVAPSAWIGEHGLEKVTGSGLGPRPAGVIGAYLQFREQYWEVTLQANLLSFLKDSEGSSGSWSLSKRGISSDFIREASVQIGHRLLPAQNTLLCIEVGGMEAGPHPFVRQSYLYLYWSWQVL